MNKITKEQFQSYLDVQKSGVTNMFYIGTVEEYSGLERNVVIDIMQNYDKLLEKYDDELDKD